MEILNSLYVVLAFAGAFILLLSIFGGDTELDLDIGETDFDISDAEVGVDSPGYFSLKTLATFLLTFGMAGIISIFYGKGIGFQLIAGFSSALFVSFLYFIVMKFMYSMQGSSMVDSNNLVNSIGTITIPTTSTGVGQVRVMTKSGNYEYTCKEVNGKKLKQNETVKVLYSESAGVIIVEKQ